MAGRVWDRDKHFLHNVCIIFSDEREATTVYTDHCCVAAARVMTRRRANHALVYYILDFKVVSVGYFKIQSTN
jgi:hypothetical protein